MRLNPSPNAVLAAVYIRFSLGKNLRHLRSRHLVGVHDLPVKFTPILTMTNAREAQLAKVSGRYPVSSRRSSTDSALIRLGGRVSLTYRGGQAFLRRLLPTADRRPQGCDGHPRRGAGLTGHCGFPATEGPPPLPLAEAANCICCSVYAAKDRSNVSTMLLISGTGRIGRSVMVSHHLLLAPGTATEPVFPHSRMALVASAEMSLVRTGVAARQFMVM